MIGPKLGISTTHHAYLSSPTESHAVPCSSQASDVLCRCRLLQARSWEVEIWCASQPSLGRSKSFSGCLMHHERHFRFGCYVRCNEMNTPIATTAAPEQIWCSCVRLASLRGCVGNRPGEFCQRTLSCGMRRGENCCNDTSGISQASASCFCNLSSWYMILAIGKSQVWFSTVNNGMWECPRLNAKPWLAQM